MKLIHCIVLAPIVGLAAWSAGCASNSDPGFASTREPDLIGSNENPARLIPGASSRLADNISPGDVGSTFGTDDAHIPYPDTYWPFVNEGVDARWASGPSPLEKYMSVVDPANAPNAKQWEHTNHGNGVPGVQSWFGHCPGWTGAAMATTPIQHPVFAKADGQGGFAACAEGSAGCTRFEIGDVNALAAEVYVDATSSFIGARCDTKPSDIQRDADGRIARNGTGCHGLNPGSLLVVLGQEMKRLHKPLAIDAQNSFNTDQIWNQPAYRYSVYRYETLATTEAANLVAHGTRTGDRTSYTWNASANGFVLVDIGIAWVSENGPNTTVVSGADSTRETRFVAVIELDADPSSSAARIIGGEYLDDTSVGANRLTAPPFVWMVQAIGPEDLPTSVGGNNHNPYLKPSRVTQLIQLGTTAGGGGGNADPCAQFNDCGTCTSRSACGFCGSGAVGCHTGTGSGPGGGACSAASWAWTGNQCSAGGTGADAGGGGADSGGGGVDAGGGADSGGAADSGSSDPCAASTACGTCTAADACGWCADLGVCATGASSGPNGGQCSGSNWAWVSSSCP